MARINMRGKKTSARGSPKWSKNRTSDATTKKRDVTFTKRKEKRGPGLSILAIIEGKIAIIAKIAMSSCPSRKKRANSIPVARLSHIPWFIRGSYTPCRRSFFSENVFIII